MIIVFIVFQREIIKEKDIPKYDELTSQFWSKPKTIDQPLTSTPKKTNESPSVKNEGDNHSIV